MDGSPAKLSWRSHTVLQGAPWRRSLRSSQPAVESILAVPSRDRPLAYVLRTYTQPATPALPGSLPHKVILPQAGLCPPQAHQPLWRHGPSPRTHHWRQLHLRRWCHSPRESWKSKKARYSKPTRHWDCPSQITSIPGGKRLWWLLTSRLSCKNVFSWWTQRNSFNTIS